MERAQNLASYVCPKPLRRSVIEIVFAIFSSYEAIVSLKIYRDVQESPVTLDPFISNELKNSIPLAQALWLDNPLLSVNDLKTRATLSPLADFCN